MNRYVIRRHDVTGADGVPLAAWDYAFPYAQAGPDGRADGRHDGPPRGDRFAHAQGDPDPIARPGVLLLHGLLGRASHWAVTARRLAPRYRALALDQRGHGGSGQPDGACTPDACTPDACAADAIAAVEQLGLAPVTLIGHSTGALTACQVAVRRPDLVAAVVICDMRAAAAGESGRRAWADWLASWPLPFATLGDVRQWFGADDPWADPPSPARGDFFAEVMAQHADGWRPLHPARHLLRSRDPWIRDAHWDELAQVACPALVVRGPDGELGRAEAQEMVRVLPRGRYAEIADAGHLVPWDQPEAWCDTLERFLSEVLPQPQCSGR